MTQRLEVRTVVDALVDALRERILTDQIPGGTTVVELEIAREYDVARPTAKTAIERLVADGLLERGSHRSARVPLLTADDVTDLYFARTCVEESALRLVAAKSTVPQGALDAQETMRRAHKEDRMIDFVDADIRFHHALVDSLDSPRLTRVHTGLLTETRMCMAQVQTHLLLDPEVILTEHGAIVAAVSAGDADAAAITIRDHLTRARGVLAAYLRAS